MIRLQIEEGLDNLWRSTINYQVNYLLAPFAKNIKFSEINFYTCKKSKHLYYCCDMLGEDMSGHEFEFKVKNSNGKTAINDTVSRVRREFLRKDKRIIS